MGRSGDKVKSGGPMEEDTLESGSAWLGPPGWDSFCALRPCQVQDMMWGSGEMTWPSGEKYTGQSQSRLD
eukprot:g15401.t1